MNRPQKLLHFDWVQDALNFLRLIEDKIGNEVKISVDMTSDDDSQSQRLFRQLETFANDPFNGAFMVFVFQRTYVDYAETQVQLRNMERNNVSEGMVAFYKQTLEKYWNREINVHELRISTGVMFRRLGNAYNYYSQLMTETKVFYAYGKDIEMKLNGGEELIGVFHTINEALFFIDNLKEVKEHI